VAFTNDTRVTVTTAATPLNNFGQADGVPGSSLAIQVPVAGQTVFVGGPGVTAATGYPYLAGSEHFIDVDDDPRLHANDLHAAPGEALYGIVASGTQLVNVLAQGI